MIDGPPKCSTTSILDAFNKLWTNWNAINHEIFIIPFYVHDHILNNSKIFKSTMDITNEANNNHININKYPFEQLINVLDHISLNQTIKLFRSMHLKQINSKYTFTKTPTNFHIPHVAIIGAYYLPQTKVIVILRDMVKKTIIL